MDWSKGYSAVYYMTIVDPVTWRDIQKMQIVGGSIKHEDSGLVESADIDCVNYDDAQERWVRIWLDAYQEGESPEHVPLFTGLDSTPSSDFRGVLKSSSVQCYSTLKPAEDVFLPLGWYAPTGIEGARIVQRLLSVTPAPVTIDGVSPMLAEPIIGEDSETNLSMAEKVLKAIGWRYRLSGDGRITICPKASSPSVRIDPIGFDIIEPTIKTENNWFDCPNVFRAIDDDLVAVARDDSEDSVLSIRNRGREVWMQDASCDLNEGETIAEYARRRLEEEQQVAISVSYDRRFVPDVYAGDIVDLYLPTQSISGYHKVVSQTITIGKSKVSEKVVKL